MYSIWSHLKSVNLLYYLKRLQCLFNTNVKKLMFMLIDGSFFILKIINSSELVLSKCENLIRVQTCPILCFPTNGNKRCLSCSLTRQLHKFLWIEINFCLDSFYLSCVLSHNKKTKYKKNCKFIFINNCIFTALCHTYNKITEYILPSNSLKFKRTTHRNE